MENNFSYVLVDQAFAVTNPYFKKNKDKDKALSFIRSRVYLLDSLAISTILGIFLGSVIPEELGLSFAVPLTFLALLVNDFRKFKNVIVMLVLD